MIAGLIACSAPAPRSPPATRTVPTTPVTASTTSTAAESPSTTTPVCTEAAAVARWPLARRAAQLVVVPALDGQLRQLGSPISAGVGGVLLLGSSTPTDLAAQVGAANRLAPTPLMVMADEEGGGVQRLAELVESLPWARQMAATWTPAQVQAAAVRTARQMQAVGVTVDLAPVLDVDGGDGPNASNPDGLRSFSADPTTVVRYGTAFADGLLQGGVTPVVKHFPGLGGATANTDYGPADTRRLAELRATGLVPFRAAVAAGAPAVMISNAAVPGLTTLPASISPAAVQTLLRDELGFHGLVLTDSLSAGSVSAAGYGIVRAAVAAVEAGADMVLFGSTLTPAETLLLSPDNVT
ncbi:MAG TPA: glycoside hydrolase family 3 N-terminal domain-containing protein, partial [Nakamurella sp.]